MWQLISQLFKFSGETGKVWFFPLVLALLAIGAGLVALKSSAIAPVLYAIF
jgi:hypothetical protein